MKVRPKVVHLRPEQELRVREAHHAGRIQERRAGVVRSRRHAGVPLAFVRQADLVHPEAAALRERGCRERDRDRRDLRVRRARRAKD